MAPKYRLDWVTEDEGDEEWLPGEQSSHSYFCNNKTELLKRYQQAVTEQGFNFEVYVWNWNQYVLSNIGEKWNG